MGRDKGRTGWDMPTSSLSHNGVTISMIVDEALDDPLMTAIGDVLTKRYL